MKLWSVDEKLNKIENTVVRSQVMLMILMILIAMQR